MHTLDARYYTDPDIYRAETQGIFAETWQYAGHVSQLRNPGDYFAFEIAGESAEKLDLRAASLSQPVGTLSGGNQQKVVIGKWLATEPTVIILDEPTKGIDIGSKAAVHAFMGELVSAGLAVIMVSSDLPEILGMSDRVVVMREGRVAGIFDRDTMDAERLVRAATGNIADTGSMT